jgi:hypothetical protein
MENKNILVKVTVLLIVLSLSIPVTTKIEVSFHSSYISRSSTNCHITLPTVAHPFPWQCDKRGIGETYLYFPDYSCTKFRRNTRIVWNVTMAESGTGLRQLLCLLYIVKRTTSRCKYIHL